MQTRSRTCSTCSRARGLTLIEVVAALAILGTLLVGIVLAKSRHTHQLVRAKTQSRAVVAVDELITDWWTSLDGVPIDEQGELLGDTPLRWQTRLVDNDEIAALGARVVRVELFDITNTTPRGKGDADPLVSVDLVVRDPEVEEREKRKAAEEAEAKRTGLKQGGGDA